MAQSLSSILGSLSIDTYRPPPCTSPISGPREELKGRQVVDASDLPGNSIYLSLPVSPYAWLQRPSFSKLMKIQPTKSTLLDQVFSPLLIPKLLYQG